MKVNIQESKKMLKNAKQLHEGWRVILVFRQDPAIKEVKSGFWFENRENVCFNGLLLLVSKYDSPVSVWPKYGCQTSFRHICSEQTLQNRICSQFCEQRKLYPLLGKGNSFPGASPTVNTREYKHVCACVCADIWKDRRRESEGGETGV